MSMTKEQRNVIKHSKLKVQAFGEHLTGIRHTIDEMSIVLHEAAYARMEEDPDAVRDLDEAAIEIFNACQKIERACGYLERAAGVKQ